MSTPRPVSTPPPPVARRRPDPFRWVIENPGIVDLVIFASAAALVGIFAFMTGSYGWWTLFSVPMIALGALCRVRPGLAVILIGSLAVLHVAVNVPVVLGDVLTFYAMFCAVAYGKPAVHAGGVIAGFAGVVVQAGYWSLLALRDFYGGVVPAAMALVSLLVVGSITVTAVWALANLQRARVRQVSLVRERAEQEVREREQRTALAVADERARIAREMHDVVAHSLSVIIAQADGGRFVASQAPEKAVDVLTTIGETGRAALADMRSLLGVLRNEDETSFGPQPGPSALPDLIDRVRAAGLQVELRIEGELAGLPQAMGVSLFRLVQEALTNVLKHAGPRATAIVHIRRTAERIDIAVIDDGRGIDPDSDGHGHGITGMRERMAMLGGTLHAAPLPGHGFRVLGSIPLGSPGAAHPDAPAPRGATDPGPRHMSGPRTAPYDSGSTSTPAEGRIS